MAITPAPEYPPGYLEALERLATLINQTKRNVWEIADTLVRLHDTLGEHYWQFLYDLARKTGSTDRVIDRWRWIASRVPPEKRYGLSIYHHEELLPLPEPVRYELAQKARDEGLTVGEVRELRVRITGDPMRRAKFSEERFLLQALLAILVEMRSKDLEEALLELKRRLATEFNPPRQKIKELLEAMEETERLMNP